MLVQEHFVLRYFESVFKIVISSLWLFLLYERNFGISHIYELVVSFVSSLQPLIVLNFGRISNIFRVPC